MATRNQNRSWKYKPNKNEKNNKSNINSGNHPPPETVISISSNSSIPNHPRGVQLVAQLPLERRLERVITLEIDVRTVNCNNKY
jgi:hypothetical protein